MARPAHDFKAYLRSMQLSRTEVYFFVEGKDCDPTYYGRLSEETQTRNKVKCVVVRADEIRNPVGILPLGGGKPKLVGFHNFLRRNGHLVDVFKGKRTVSVFFADKDIDDLLKKLLRSRHFLYTKWHSVENHLILAADLHEAIASTCSLAPGRVPRDFHDVNAWTRKAAERWKEWVACCVLSQKCKSGVLNYGSESLINVPATANTDAMLLRKHLNRLSASTGIEADKIKRKYLIVEKMIEGLYARNEHNAVFRGKWYLSILFAELKASLPRTAVPNGFKKIMLGILRAKCTRFPCEITRNSVFELVDLYFPPS